VANWHHPSRDGADQDRRSAMTASSTLPSLESAEIETKRAIERGDTHGAVHNKRENLTDCTSSQTPRLRYPEREETKQQCVQQPPRPLGQGRCSPFDERVTERGRRKASKATMATCRKVQLWAAEPPSRKCRALKGGPSAHPDKVLKHG
jgi:hypothetical protein